MSGQPLIVGARKHINRAGRDWDIRDSGGVKRQFLKVSYDIDHHPGFAGSKFKLPIISNFISPPNHQGFTEVSGLDIGILGIKGMVRQTVD